MDQTLLSQAARFGSQQLRTDIAVITAMGLVSIAISVALGLHFGLSMSRAGVAGVLIFALLAGAHFLLVPRADTTQDVTELEDEELWRALKEQRRNAPDAQRMALATRGDVAEPMPESPAVDDAEPTRQTELSGLEEPTQAADAPSAAQHVPRRKPRIIPKAAVAEETSPTAPAVDEHAPGQSPHQGQKQAEQAETDRVQAEGTAPDTIWSYRPSKDAVGTEPQFSAPAPEASERHEDPVFDSPTLAADPVAAQDHTTAEMKSQPPSESDVELVQSMIKKLAHQVNAREVLEQTAPSGDAHAEPAANIGPAPQAAQPPELPNPVGHQPAGLATADAPQIIAQMAPPQPTPPATPGTVDLVTESVGALRTTADAMREADEAAPDDAPQVDQPVRPAARRDAGHVAQEISAALNAGQVGVLLEPILTLNGMRPDHYEVSLQISPPASADLDSAGVERDLQATAVLGEVDRERFIKAISVGELLRERGKAGSLLTRIYRESLLDRDFCFAVATSGVANEDLARHMVLTLSQEAVRALTASEWQTLSEFHELGYRFAMSHVSDLDMDFAQLTAAGFGFVKLSSDAFLAGFLDGEGTITPQELSRYLAQVGLTVIVEDLENSAQAAHALAMGVGLGQGSVTGGPRLLKSDAVVRDDHAVA